jgi:hypothetical protein
MIKLKSLFVQRVPGALKRWAALPLFAVVLLCAGYGIAHAGDAGVNSTDILLAKYAALQDRLNRNAFGSPLYLESSENQSGVAGDIYALVNHPFSTVGTALNTAGNWCEILILHLNTKYCRASTAGQGNVLNVSIGKKHDQPLEDAYRVTFDYRVTARTAKYLQVKLNAAEGPLSTRDYRIVLEAVHLDNGQTFIHLSYAYGYGLAGRLAMQAYLGTIASKKVGFTVVGTEPGGQPIYVGGMRGLVERNTMRYYLAIEAFLGALSTPQPARVETSLRMWFAAIERYPRQLHELEQHEYLDMKRKEYLRQQAAARAFLFTRSNDKWAHLQAGLPHSGAYVRRRTDEDRQHDVPFNIGKVRTVPSTIIDCLTLT